MYQRGQLSVVQLSCKLDFCAMNIKEKIGIKLKEFRTNKGLSQEKLAHLADLDRTYIPDIEKGERNISIVVLEKLATALNIPIQDFFNEH